MTLRKLLPIALLCTTGSLLSQAQSWTVPGGTSNLVTDATTNNVGINTSTPIDKLTVNGDITITKANDSDPRLIWGRTSTGFLGMIAGGSPYSNGSMMLLYGANSTSSNPGSIGFYAAGTQGSAFSFFSSTGGGYNPVLNISRSGDLQMLRDADGDYRNIQGTSSAYGLGLAANTTFIDGSALRLYGTSHASTPGQIQLISNGTSSTATGFLFTNSDAGSLTDLVSIKKDGKVLIGTGMATMNLPSGYSLFVEKGILTEKVKVAIENSTNWADHVFSDSYKLTPLTQVENYIKTNGHLPEIPSAAQVVENGIDLGEMNAKLLQKVEELTLYVIQQQKEIDILKNSRQGSK